MPMGRLRVGSCVVDMASREVHVPDAKRPLRLAPKAVAVLATLARQAGQVVSREQLLAEVWPDTLPTNDVVTQAITQLRKAFASHGGQRSDYIETIAKTGYRLLAPVSWEESADPVATPSAPASAPNEFVPPAGPTELAPRHPPPVAAALPVPVPPQSGSAGVETAQEPASRGESRSRRRLGWLLVGVALLLAVVVISVVWWRGPTTDATAVDPFVSPKRPYQVITAGGGFDLTPSLSPDGAMMAYASLTDDRPGTSILVKTTNNAYPRVLDTPAPGASDRLPAWSPDGRQIAFARTGADGSCRIMVAAANGQPDARELARCDGADMLSFSWSPDGRRLLFGTMTGSYGGPHLRTLDLESGAWQPLHYSADAKDFDYQPRYSPDGRWIVFLRNPQLGDLWRVPANGGRAERLDDDLAEIRGWSWLPDSSGLVVARRVGSEARLYRLSLHDRSLHDLGVDDAQAPDVAGRHLVFVQRRPQFALFQVVRDAINGGYVRRRLFPSSGRDTQPSIAPDGRQLLFASNRSGDYGLWWGDVTKPGSARLIEGIRPDTREAADWSADGRSALVSGIDDQGRAVLYEVEPVSGQAQVLPVPEGQLVQAIHVPDPRQILVLAAAADGRVVATLYDRRRVPWRPLATLPDVSQLHLDRSNGQVLLTRISSPGLWQIAPSLAPDSLRPLHAKEPSRWRFRSWAPGPGAAVHYLSSTDECATYDGDLHSGSGHCMDAAKYTALNGFSVDQNDGALYLALAEEDGSAIGFMELPASVPPPFGFISNILIFLGKLAS
ncbi:winged helix-turn-helix domain-containing protein [Xanthomonas maliensis]|uniref:winged helix-turn-helix domain-containing protein n=2 Tax=Xanthomonas maliensis TaxID=1321368 RepID=UPI0014782CB0|nr:winged helix-turn-helix domain-containing protein [Xanthomonas maliensis]